MSGPPRLGVDRRRDTEHRLQHDVDLWVATASTDGTPHLVPLSFDWDGESLLLSTSGASVTARNLVATQTVRLALGDTRDVTIIEGSVDVLAMAQISQQRADTFARRTGFDPRRSGPSYRWFRIWPRRIQAWREEDELAGRELMRDGRWLA